MNEPTLVRPPCFHRRIASRASPVELFERLYAGHSLAFLYESLEARGGRGRYSFLGGNPQAVFTCHGQAMSLEADGRVVWRGVGDPLGTLRRLIGSQPDAPPVAPFCGGAVGYLGYDSVRWIERLPVSKPDDAGLPDAMLLFPREVICFDHLDKVVHVLLYLEADPAARFAEIQDALAACGVERPDPGVEYPSADADSPLDTGLRAGMSRQEFCRMVDRAKEYILAGDVFQVVLSQRFTFDLRRCGERSPAARSAGAVGRVAPLRLYKALRVTNPSPYMYYLALNDLHIAGSSPEILVRLSGRRVVTRPLAGTRPRGTTPEHDAALEAELRADPKERAEHVMLVDLGRNDLGRVCEFGSVAVTEALEVERHSRVMHLVSNVEGWLRSDRDAVDVFASAFPAGTVSGAPKVRAMQIIDELEPVRRGVYAGAIGYFSLLGDVDLCIAIRTIVIHGNTGAIQAGAGIVADSVAEREYEETLNKARALFRAVSLAARDD